jgi:cyclopropane-fatty-acyl-phospholipid synthase
MWFLNQILSRVIRTGHLRITDHDGQIYDYGDVASAPISIKLTDRGAAGHIARHLDVGAGEAYMDGRLVVDLPHDIRDMILLFMANANAAKGSMRPKNPLRRSVDRLAAVADQFSFRHRTRRNIEHHYALTRQFYELFLDEDRQYTMAYFRDPDNTLEQAQIDKKALIASKLGIKPGMRVLDIGCGWGGLGLYLNRHYGCEVLGVSLAPDQVRFANERAAAAGVAGQVKFELVDYRDVSGTFDRITSVGMVEHVGKPHLGEYFAKTFDLLAEDGAMLTHSIGRGRGGPGVTDKWTRTYIFPGGYIPALSEFATAIERGGWEMGDIEVLRHHYAYTLREWYRRACLHRDEIVSLYDERMFRMWQFYLAGAEQSFLSGGLVNFQIITTRRKDALPITRDYLVDEAARLQKLDYAPQWHLDPALKEAAE